jgi:hypothetical protein
MRAMREFRPPVRPSLFRTVFGVGMGLMLLVFAALMVALASGSNRITYAIAGGTLTVDSGSRFDGVRTIPLARVHERSVVSLQGARRSRGTSMAGYCTGRWSYPALGTVWQATNCSSPGVLLVTSDGDLPVVVTPPDPAAFIAALEAGQDLRIALPQTDATILRVLPVVGAVFALVMGGIVVGLMLLGPGRMAYRVGEGRLEVSTLLGRRSWPLQELRARPHSPRVTLRVAGTAAPGYYTGLFRVDGTSTRIYATDLKSGVLLEGPARVYLSPEDVPGFLDALRVAGAQVEAV